MSIIQFQSIISKIDTSSVFVIDNTFSKKEYVPLDLSIDNKKLLKVDVSSSCDLGCFIDQVIEDEKGTVAYGGYLETRLIYRRSTYFNQELNPSDERNIHLGVDIWKREGTDVLTALDGEVHSFNNNLNYGDYGPTIILKHTIDNFVFFTLYGHLSLSSLVGLEKGRRFQQGDKIAELGSSEVNGDYPAHLHFQIILDVENYLGDYPGVSSMNSLEFYRNNCPDPNLLLGLKM